VSFENDLNSSIRLLTEFVCDTICNNIATSVASGDLNISVVEAEEVSRIVKLSTNQAFINGYSEVNATLKRHSKS
tara:strand:+ start:1643 stop:1867 length:225 start_codon:yes stop_codon:yes gene_type:complete